MEEASDKVLTVPNVITMIRLLMIPVAFVFLIQGQNLIATALFAIAALTDCLDGQIARRTHCVSKVGQLLDPLVDRLLMIAGVLGLLIVGWLPLWIVVVILIRDIVLLVGGSILYKGYGIRIPVIFPGKVATTFLFIGFAALMLHMPMLTGLGWVSVSWLPFFSAEPYCWGILFVYAGMLVGVFTTTYYCVESLKALQRKKNE